MLAKTLGPGEFMRDKVDQIYSSFGGILAALVDWWLPGRRSSLAVVIAEAKSLSSEIYGWMAERDRDHNANAIRAHQPACRSGRIS